MTYIKIDRSVFARIPSELAERAKSSWIVRGTMIERRFAALFEQPEPAVPRIAFVSPDGRRQEFDVPEGTSAMAAARRNSVSGIEAECGGSLSCGTCHVYVEATFASKLPAPSEQETEMLDLVAADREPGSRLSCQILVDGAVDGIEIRIPASQY